MTSPLEHARQLADLLERFRAGTVDRRRFVSLLGAGGLAAGVALEPSSASAQSGPSQGAQIRYDSFGGAVAEALRRTGIATYAKLTGGRVTEGTYGSEDEIMAKVKAGRPGDYNIVSSAGLAYYKRWIDAGLGAVISEANIPNLKNVMPVLINPLRKMSPKGISAVPYAYASNGICYNTKFISHAEARAQREKLLVRKDLKGKIAGYDNWQTRIWSAACVTGQNPNDIKDINAVWDVLRTERTLVKKYWGSGAESTDLLATEEVYVTDIWSGRAGALMNRFPNFGYVEFSHQYGSLLNMLVLKGAPVEACEVFLNIVLEKDVAVAIAEAQLYPPPFDPTKIALPPTMSKIPAFDPTGKLEGFGGADPDFWTRYEKDWKPMYARVSKGF